jgi:hypothetical protein
MVVFNYAQQAACQPRFGRRRRRGSVDGASLAMQSGEIVALGGATRGAAFSRSEIDRSV